MKDFSEGLKKAQAEFESTGDYKAWDKSIQNLQTRKMTLSQKRKKKSLVQDTKISIFNQHPNSKCFYAK